MPLETNLSRSPYFNDYTESKDYYGILFKPSVALQARELNQLQSILQKQIERFGDHVFKSGTIISGVNFRYLPNYQYIKVLDLQVDGQPTSPVSYEGLFVKNSSNLVARIVKTSSGFEQKDPDLNTLYLQYVNSSDTGNTSVYSNGEVLTVYSKDYPVYSVDVNNGGVNFSNSDSLIVVSALSVNIASGSFSNGETITQATTGAQATVIGVNNSIIANTLVLQIKPLNADLANTSANTSEWTFTPGYNITGGSSGAVANVTSLVGSGATGVITTDSLGVVVNINVQAGGNTYIIPPHVTIKPTNNTASISTLSLSSKNYKAQVTIANNDFTAPVGNGYAFSTTEGIIYQKGYFLRVDPQVIIVDKYSGQPNNVVVGFKTSETTANVNTDSTLYDNALGTTNFAAPGADRLKLVPELVTISSTNAAANVEFFTLVEFKNGEPYKENRNTVYNILGKEFARRTSETSGDFVVDEFLVITKDKDFDGNTSLSNTTHNAVVVDPGLAYISGERIQTLKNTYLDVRKSTDTLTKNRQVITANYGNHIRIKELAGNFKFKSGDTISLYDTAQAFLTNVSAPTTTSITPTGSAIGTARIRSLVYESGEPGTPEAIYRAYLFDIKMSAGKVFRNVRSVYYNGTNDGVADAVLEYNPTTSAYEATLKDTDNSNLLFPTGLNAVKVANAVSFTYRTTDEAVDLYANGMLTLSLIASGEQFPYTASSNLTLTQKNDIIVVPLANAEASANLTGTVAVTTSSNLVIGSGTSFSSNLRVGDYVKLAANATTDCIRRVTGITNATHISINSNSAFANTSATIKKFFPAFYPIPLASRDNRDVVVGANNNTLRVYLNETLSGAVSAAVTYNVKRSTAVQSTKTVHRDSFIKLYTGNNVASSTGPWSLGLPDAVRLKNVYLGNTASDLDVTKHFYIDQGHDGNFYGQSYLVKKSTSTLEIANTQWLLVKCDNFTSSGEGFLTVSSYSINDGKTLAASSNTINTVEIPEVITADKQYFDLRDSFDFRPYVANTVAIATTVSGAPINPANTESFNSNDKLFPTPDSEIAFDAEYYLSRVDRVVAKKDGSFQVLEGTPAITGSRPPRKPNDSVTLSIISTSPYPSLPLSISNTNLQIFNKSVGNELGEINTRIGKYTSSISTSLFEENNQAKSYTMTDIGNLEKRINQLEYYVSLNLLETKVKDLVIPSAINPSVNRFKNGFFVDDFDDYTFAEESSKEFNAKIEQSLSELHPKTKQFNLNSIFSRNDVTTNNAIYNNNSILLPFVEESLITQELATSTVNSDGNKTNYGGSVVITPSSFRLRTRGEVKITPDPAPPSGGDGGGGGDCKIICAKLNELGFFEDDINTADQAFGRYLRDSHPEVFNGYLAWAQTVVDWMEGHGPKVIPFISKETHSRIERELTIKYLNKLARPWAEEMAYMMGVREKSSLAGKIIMTVGLPMCWVIGKLGFKPVVESSKLRGYAVWGICTVLLLTSLIAQAIEVPYNKITGFFSKFAIRGLKRQG
jgi:hypothetical protein